MASQTVSAVPGIGVAESAARLADLGGGARVSMRLVLEQKRVRQTKSGSPYLVVNLVDRSGSMRGVMFDFHPDDDALNVGCVVEVSGMVEVFNGDRRLKISRMVSIPDADPAALARESNRPVAEMSAEYGQFVASLTDPVARETVKRILRTDGLYARLKHSPLAEDGYGAWDGGALEHTLRVVRLADSACQSQPEVDRDLVVASALLHQVGAAAAVIGGARPTLTPRGRALPRGVLGILAMQAGLGDPEHRLPFDHRLEDLVARSAAAVPGTLGADAGQATLEEIVLRGSIELAYSVGRRAAHANVDGKVVPMRRIS